MQIKYCYKIASILQNPYQKKVSCNCKNLKKTAKPMGWTWQTAPAKRSNFVQEIFNAVQ